MRRGDALRGQGARLRARVRDPRPAARWPTMARESLAGAAAVFAGSEHIVAVTEELLGEGAYRRALRIVPPGVDTDGFAPGRGSLPELLRLLEAGAGHGSPGHPAERAADAGAAAGLAGSGRFVLYFGKLMRQKGVHLLLDAWRDVGAAPSRRRARDRRVRRRPGRARGGRPAGRRSSPGRWITSSCSCSCRWPRRSSCRRCCPRRSGWWRPRPPRARSSRSSPTTRAWPRWRRGWARPGSRSTARAADLAGAAGRAARPARGRARAAGRARPRGGRGPVELGGDRPAAARRRAGVALKRSTRRRADTARCERFRPPRTAATRLPLPASPGGRALGPVPDALGRLVRAAPGPCRRPDRRRQPGLLAHVRLHRRGGPAADRRSTWPPRPSGRRSRSASGSARTARSS